MSGIASEIWEGAYDPEAADYAEAGDEPGSQRWIGAVAMLVSAGVSLSTLWWLGHVVAGLFAG